MIGHDSTDGGRNVFYGNASLGLEKKGTSLWGLNVYRGPLFSDVEKSLKDNQKGSNSMEGLDMTMVTWRRIDCGDTKKIGEHNRPD
jgi:hypothetical protein